MNRILCASIFSLAICGICSAGPISFLTVSASGTFSGPAIDTADSLVTPGDTLTLTFEVPTSPTITNSTTLSFDVPVLGFVYDLNGSPDATAPQPTEITFYTAADGGGYQVAFGPSAEFLFSSSQIFTGTTAVPAFAPGTFNNQSYLFLDNNNVDSNSATAILAPAPEPSSILLLLGVAIGLFAARFKQ